MQANMGMAGEFRVVVKRADGSTKIDTGYQKNLILNQGLDFFGAANGGSMMAYCVIGSGNSQPVYTQNKLDTAVSGVSGIDYSTKYDYNPSTDGSLYKTNKVRKYSFSWFNNVNISELGLASTYSNNSTYFLCTRALIKDSQGNPITITVLSGEQLNIYYKLWAVYDTTDKTGKINLLDGVGGSIAYNYRTRLANVGLSSRFADSIGSAMETRFMHWELITSEPVDITSDPTTSSSYPNNAYLPVASSYTNSSYKRTYTYTAPISLHNQGNRTLILASGLTSFYMMWQIRFGAVADGSPITKTNTQTLSIPIEFSWGRYEGAL